MKFVFTKHAAKDKLPLLRRFGWVITRTRVKEIVKNPQWSGLTKKGQKVAMGLANESHILRVIFRKEDDIITIITLHIARRGKYESTLR